MLTALGIFLFFTPKLFRVFLVYKKEEEAQIKLSPNKNQRNSTQRTKTILKGYLKLRVLLRHLYLKDGSWERSKLTRRRWPLSKKTLTEEL